MKFMFVLIFAFALMVSGCIETVGENVPVLYVNVTMGEEINGTMIIQAVEAHAGEMPKLKAPRDQLAQDFPAVYVNVVQDMFPRGFQTGKDYFGPGVYNFTMGIEREINKSGAMGISVQALNKSDIADLKAMRFKWSTEKQSATFI